MAFVSTCSRQEHSLYCLWLVCFLSVYMYERVLQKFVFMFFSVSSICHVKSNLIPKSGGGLLGISCSLSVSCLQIVVSMMRPAYLFGLRLRILVYPRFLAFPSSPQDIGAVLVGSLPGTLTQARTSFLPPSCQSLFTGDWACFLYSLVLVKFLLYMGSLNWNWHESSPLLTGYDLRSLSELPALLCADFASSLLLDSSCWAKFSTACWV